MKKWWAFWQQDSLVRSIKQQPIEEALWNDFRANPQDYAAHPKGGGQVHKTAWVDPTATIHKNSIIGSGSKVGDKVNIGPWCCIDSNVELGDGVAVGTQVTIGSHTKIGNYGSVGVSQDNTEGNPTRVLCRIGENTVIGTRAKISPNVTVEPDVEVGDGSLLHPYQNYNGLYISGGTRIGQRVKVEVEGLGANTQLYDGVSLYKNGTFKSNLKVGNDVRVGLNSSIDFEKTGFFISLSKPTQPTFANFAPPPQATPAPAPEPAVEVEPPMHTIAQDLREVRPSLGLNDKLRVDDALSISWKAGIMLP